MSLGVIYKGLFAVRVKDDIGLRVPVSGDSYRRPSEATGNRLVISYTLPLF